MIRGVSLEWLHEMCSSCIGENILLYPANGLELSFFSNPRHVYVYTESAAQKAWIQLLIVSFENLRRTGLETLFGLNKAGRRVFLYHQLRTLLDAETRDFWDSRENMIREGLLCDVRFEQMLSRLNYPGGKLRWKTFGHVACALWQKENQQIDAALMFSRLHERKKSVWSTPWRDKKLVLRIPEHEKKSILPKISEVQTYSASILKGIENMKKNSIDTFLLWDGIVDLARAWPAIKRAATKDAYVLVACAQENPFWWSALEQCVVSYTSDAHFSFGRVVWLKVQ